MDVESIQLLNLSPIPELSEIELSTMLDHLSGLSDINADLTDRNVEELLKEAEDLLDKSESNKTLESKDLNENQDIEDKSLVINQDVDDLNNNEDHTSLQSDINISTCHNSLVKRDHASINISPDANINANKHYNSPVESTSSKIYSPGGSCNHIKSTIDSLREFSTLIEQALSNKYQKSSPQHSETIKLNEKKLLKEIPIVDDHLTVIDSKQGITCSKTVKSPEPKKKETPEPLNKSIKVLNCFERLYQDRPVRFLTSKKPKVTDKMPKTVLKKKFSKELKNIKKSNWPVKTEPRKMLREDIKENAEICEKMNDFILKSSPDEGKLFKPNKINSQNSIFTNRKDFSPKKKAEKGIEDEFSESNLNNGFQSDHLESVQSRINEKLMLKVLEEVEVIKDQVKKANALSERGVKEDQKSMESSKPEINLKGEKFCVDSVKNTSIKRLEEQFSNLKEKYDHQIEKLESENIRLRIALNDQQKIIASQMSTYTDIFKGASFVSTEAKSYKTSPLISPSSSVVEKKVKTIRENCRTPENCPCALTENVQPSITAKNAFSQTESEFKNACTQYSQESKEVGTDGNTDILGTKKTENKENLSLKKKLAKGKLFSDINVHQLIKQTKAFDRETQLLATLRGLQAELSIKDKENRKLKTEIDSLRRQIKKIANAKVEICRKCNVGTQTLGLGSFVQKPYNPENYEVPQEFEKENDELRSRIKAFEKDFELLNEKRISDLQSLHQVHEEEMAKLVSKLETQSALTRHLYLLLINR